MPKVKGNTKILVCMHKRTNIISDGVYTPIQVGRAIANGNYHKRKLFIFKHSSKRRGNRI
jgi:hypothetical protein